MNSGDKPTGGRAKGGIARANALTAEEKKQIASKGAAARWSKDAKLPQATHMGELKIGEAVIPCAVLPDGSRLLTQAGFLRALGRSEKPKGRSQQVADGLPPFLATNSLKSLITDDLLEKTVPVVFRTVGAGNRALGYRAELLPQVCNLFLAARDRKLLTSQQEELAAKCEILIRALAETGLVALVDEATGYQYVRPQDALQAYLEKVLSRELAAWAKRFPDEFYENIYKLKGWPWPGMGKNRYSVVGKYTTDLVYDRLGPGITKELVDRSPKNDEGNRKNRLHQWLSDDVGHPLLAQHLHSLIMFQRLAITSGYGWNRYVKMVDQVLPKRGDTMELPLNDYST
jgi:hypothetical protein